MNTVDYKTKTNLDIARKHPTGDNWIVGLDIGYSAVKGFSANSLYSFPSFAKRAKDTLNFAAAKPTDIQYRDKDGALWEVGESAEAFTDVNDSELSLYGRVRYFADSFKVIAETGLALGIKTNSCGGIGDKKVFVQTGLPPIYRKQDAPMLTQVLTGHHEFDLKVGTEDWIHYDFTIDDDQVSVIDQPMAGLVSAATTVNGKPSADARRYFNSYALLLDVGFGTADIYDLHNGKIATDPQTFENLGMKRIFEETCKEIEEKCHESISVPMLQTYLDKGTIRSFDRMAKKTTTLAFGEILEEKARMVCDELINKLMDMYEMENYAYVILDGGTSAAWASHIKETFKSFFGDELSVISATQNDTILPIFANARGYYMFRLNS